MQLKQQQKLPSECKVWLSFARSKGYSRVIPGGRHAYFLKVCIYFIGVLGQILAVLGMNVYVVFSLSGGLYFCYPLLPNGLCTMVRGSSRADVPEDGRPTVSVIEG